jgi:COP9 signalosome complex subunit 3
VKVLVFRSVKANMPSVPDVETFIHQVSTFVKLCSPKQIKHASESYCSLCHQYTRLVIDSKKSIRGIETVKLAIQKLQPSPYCLTSMHADLAQLCLVSKCFKPALPFLDSDISEFVPEVSFLVAHEMCLMLVVR